MSKLPPRVLAVAYADLAAEEIREAHAHLEAWDALSRSGVPVHDLRHALEAERVNTEAGSSIASWRREGERGVLLVRGPVDCGKTFGAVRWAFDRHRRGLATRWYQAVQWPNSFESMDQLCRELERVPGLVIDDLGDGAASPEMRKRVRGLLSVRVAADLPTVIVSNATAAEIEEWIGVRQVSRLKLGGGLIDIEATLNMRTREATPYDFAGRSPRWYAAKRTVDIFGAESRDVYNETGEFIGRRIDVGHVLERAAWDPRRGVAALEEVTRAWWIEIGDPAVRIDMPPLLSVAPAVVELRAHELLAEQRRAVGQTGRALGRELEAASLTWEAALADAHRVMAAELAKANAHRQQEAEAASRPRGRTPDPARLIRLPSGPTPPRQDCIRQAYRHGLRVREVGSSELVMVDGSLCAARESSWAVYNGEKRMAEGFASDGDAWHWAWLQVKSPVDLEVVR